MTSYHWSVHQLTEYFDAVSRPTNVYDACVVAVEHAAEALDAEIGAVVLGDDMVACIGFGRDTPMEELRAVAAGATTLTVAGFELLCPVIAPLGSEIAGVLVLARQDEAFGAEEMQMLLGMARILGLALRNLRILETERQLRTAREREATERLSLLESLSRRERLLDALLTIQRAISHRAPLQEILDSVTASAAALLENAFVALVMEDPLGGDNPVVPSVWSEVATQGHDPSVLAAAVESMRTDTAVAIPSPLRADGLTAAGDRTLVAAPVRVEGRTVGSLVTVVPSGPSDVDDRLTLLDVFAAQASLALTDAHTLAEMREAYHDSLTGLPNRALFMDRLEHAMETATRAGGSITVLFVDLDRFKTVNDSLGHTAGDELLAAVAHRIKGCLRAADTAARLGGDEFAVLLELADDDRDGQTVAARLLEAMRAPFTVAGRQLSATASVGIATTGPLVEHAGDLLRNADLAMYHAKHDGHGQAMLFEPEMYLETVDTIELEADLRRAVEACALHVHYQPIVDLATSRPVAVEALLRWQHPTRGLVPPIVFIPVAEHAGVIGDLGRWVLEESTAQVAAWRKTVQPDLILNVNISARQFDDPAFTDSVIEALRRADLDPRALVLEITESTLTNDAIGLLTRLSVLRDLGIRISMDDFGTGYSSLASLRTLPVDQVKLDKSFIDGIVQTPRDLAIARSVIELGVSLGVSTVAEGIEHLEQAQVLRRLGCQLGQGYLFARPMAPSQVETFLAAAPSAVAEQHLLHAAK